VLHVLSAAVSSFSFVVKGWIWFYFFWFYLHGEGILVANGFVTDDAAAALPREKEERYLSTYHHRRRRRVVGQSSGRHVWIMLWICSDSGDVVAHSVAEVWSESDLLLPSASSRTCCRACCCLG
jgi:hypothetical protein